MTISCGYMATPYHFLGKILDLLELKQGEIFYDLGSGDGRILTLAASKYGVKAIGIEIDSKWVEISRKRVREEGLESETTILHGDIFEIPFYDADAIFMFLNNVVTPTLGERRLVNMRPGVRIASVAYQVPQMKARHKIPVYLPEYDLEPDRTAFIYVT